MLGDLKGKEHVLHLLVGRFAFGNDFQVFFADDAVIHVLYQHTAGYNFDHPAMPRRIRKAARRQNADFFFLREEGQGVGLDRRRDNNLAKYLDNIGGCFFVQRLV